MKKILLLLSVPVLFASCSPTITGSIIKEKSPVPDTQAISIYESKDEITSGYEVVGTVSAGDAGLTTRCDEQTMLALLQQKSREMGGNAVLITEHKYPSFWSSSCHRFKGVVLNESDALSISEEESALLDGATLNVRKLRNMPRFTLSGNVGFAWKQGETGGDRLYDDLKSGYQMNLSADYFFSDYFGLRLGYQRFWSNATEPLWMFSDYGDFQTDLNGKFILNSIYPAFVMRIGTHNQKWIFDMSVGIGYINYLERLETDYGYEEYTASTVDFQMTIGAQYMLTKNLGIGAVLTGTSGSLGEVKADINGEISTETMPDGQRVGLGQTGLLLGLRYHIW
jgi:hypothetical protein